jgi:hypothetical protein
MTPDLTSGTLRQKTGDNYSSSSSCGNQHSRKGADWVRELATSLEKSRRAVLHSDLKGLTLEIARQRELCSALSGQVQGESELRGLLSELQEASRANHRYAAVLTRARRTVDIFCRVLANSTVTYERPPRSAALGR